MSTLYYIRKVSNLLNNVHFGWQEEGMLEEDNPDLQQQNHEVESLWMYLFNEFIQSMRPAEVFDSL